MREIGSPSSRSHADPVAAVGFPTPPSARAARTGHGHLKTRMTIAIQTSCRLHGANTTYSACQETHNYGTGRFITNVRL